MSVRVHGHRPEFLRIDIQQGLRTVAIFILALLFLLIIFTQFDLIQHAGSWLPQP